MGNKGLGKKLLVYLMTFMMVFSTMPVNVFAVGQKSVNTNEGQIGNHYAVDDATGELPAEPSLSGNTQQLYEDGKVKVNKTISATGTENVFDVELTVETTQDVSKISYSPDAAAVILIDCSNSMKACMSCQHTHENSSKNSNDALGECYGTGDDKDSDDCSCTSSTVQSAGFRIAAAHNAAQMFINDFASDTANRPIAVVMFSGSKNSSTVVGAENLTYDQATGSGWVEASTLKTSSYTVHSDVVAEATPAGGTNIHAGMVLAQNLLDNLATVDEYKSIASKSIILISDGAPSFSLTDSAAGNNSIYKIGTNQDNDFKGPGNTTNGINCAQHTPVEAIAESLSKNNVDLYATYIGNETVTCNDCNVTQTGATWLDKACGFTTYSANDTDEIMDKFQTIIQTIEKNAQAWTVIDPMGPYVDYVSPTPTSNGEFSVTNDTLTWNLRKAEDLDPSDDSYKYVLKYRVKLNNLSKYTEGTSTNTNDITKLKYIVTTTENGEQTSAKEGTAYFNIPSVKGYKGDYSFKKVDNEGEPVKDAVFTLTTEDDPSWSMSATSDANGNVVFEGIPSGHTYSLEESSVPANYKPSGEKHTMVVSYGQVTVDGSTDSIEVVNEKKQTTTVSGTKRWVHNGSDSYRPSQITLYLYANGELVESDVLEDGKTNPLIVKGNNNQNEWEYSFGQLPVKDSNGNTIKYTVLEKELDRYYPTYDGYNITNTRQNSDKTSITVLKSWNDANDKDELRPESVTVKLTGTYRAGNQQYEATYKTATLTASNNWTYTFTDLDEKYKGRYGDYTITYTVSEVTSVNGYTTETGTVSNGIVTITNTHVPVEDYDFKTSYSGTKAWSDGNDKNGLRPGSLKVALFIDEDGDKLLDDNEKIVSESPTWTKNGSTWTYTFNNLSAFDKDGNVINYVANETAVPQGYEMASNISMPTSFFEEIGFNIITPGSTKLFELGNLSIDNMIFIATKRTSNAPIMIWTPRAINDTEKQEIHAALKSKANNLSEKSVEDYQYVNGLPYIDSFIKNSGVKTAEIYLNDNGVLSIKFNASDVWSLWGYGNIKTNYTPGSADFTNTLSVDPAKLTIKGTKTLTGRDMRVGEFSFEVAAADDVTIQAITDGDITGVPSEAVAIDAGAAGKAVAFDFDELTFNKIGTYKFNVTENMPSDDSNVKDGVTYDTNTAVVTVSVTYDADNNKLVANAIYDNGENSNATDKAVFKNTYTAAPADVLIKVTKDLSGRDWLDSDSFSFTLKNDSLGINDSLTLTKDKKSGAFDSIEIDKPGKYTFKIKENIPSDAVDGKFNGITYDRNNERTVKVTVTDNGKGQLVANVTGDTYTGANGEVFTNIYAPTPVQLPISGTKVMDGKTLNAGDFEFTITAAEGTPMPANTTVKNGEGSDIDRFTFGSIEYTKAGTYTYTIKETKGNAPGVAYDNSEITAIVTVAEDQATGTLSANVVYKKGEETLNGLMFTNRYTVEPSDEVAFSASKKVTGHAYDLEAGKFSFTLSPSKDNGDNDPINNDITVTNDEYGAVSFIEDAVYTEPGTYKYSVTEDHDNEIKGITYDNSTYLITVTVKENTQTAKLDTEIAITKDGKPVNAIVFSNNYKPTECTAVIKGKKSLSGKGMEAFTFQITQHQSTPNAPLPQDSEVQNDTAGVFEFNYGNITYTEAGTYVYEVTEKAVDKAGYTYDQSKYIVTVTVTDVNGELKSAVKYEKNGEEKAEMTFANDYTPAPVKVSIDGEKSLTGRDLNEGEFTFKLLDAKGEAVATAVNGGNGKFSFSDLTFTGTGTYTYTVVEDKSGTVLPGVTYSNEIYNVIIVVTDQNYDGQLDAAVKYYKNDSEVNGIEFTNTYEPAPAKLTLSGTKTFTGRDMKAGESFEFVLSADKLNANAQSLLPNGMKVTVSDGKNGVPKSFTFGELTFTEPGTYRFDVNETKPANTNGIIYDTDTVNVTVKVDHDVNNGRLVVSEVKYNEGLFDKENGIAFENTFEPVSAVFEAEKVLTGRDLKAGEFTFQLVDANGNVIQEKTNDADGNIVFDAIEYDGTGNHTYTINEVQGDLGGVSYDNVPVNVTATVTVDDRTEKLVAVTAYEKNGSDNAVFNNSYTTGSIEVGLTGQKVLTGRDLEAGEFSFVLKDDDGNVLQTKENAAGGSITFDAIEYTEAGTYTYTISEIKGDLAGITYDEETVYVTVTVTDDGKGALSSSVTYSKGGETAAFTNTYSAAPASLSFSGSKVLTGRTLNEDEFSFVLKDAAGKEIETVTNTANGTISFDAIEYTEAGTYTYTISEIKGDLPGITYDEETVYVTVTVTDDGKGALKAEAKYKKGPNGEEKGTFAFENAYQTAPADPVSVEAKKSVETNTGDRYVLKDGEFEFQIIPGQNPANDPVSAGTTKNDINGMIEVFSNAVYEQAGTYTYTLLETNSGVPGFGYSTTKYEIKVDVSDNIAKAKLNADVILTDITDPENPIVVEELVFVNTYDTKAATANIYGKKTVDASEGNSYTLKGGEFTFVLTPENENTPMPSNTEVTNLDTGAFTFGEIKYVRPGTYKYIVSEKAGDLQGFTYSDKEYNVTVKVTDVNSVLVAEVTGITDDDGELIIDFTNKYEPTPDEVKFKALKVMNTSDSKYALKGGDYNFQLRDSAKNIMQNKKNDADGTVSFDSITYTKPGNYTYYVSEEKGNDENLIYDDTVYQVDVTVTDNNGNLEAVVKTGNAVIDEPEDMTFTNVYETVSINGTKVWDDASDQDGIRPDKVSVKLLAGEEVVATKEISGQGDVWNWTFDNLPKYKNDSEIEYSVAEIDVPDGYTKTVSGDQTNGFTITNKHTPETTEVSVAKVWDDEDNQDNIRPASITVQLKSGDDVVDEFILNEANQWTATASNLSKYADGDEIEYTWIESAVPAGYKLTDTKVRGDLTTFTNTHTPEITSVTVTKAWDDADNQDNIRPGSVEVQLYANSNAVGDPIKLKGADWTHTWTDLDKKSEGRDIVYTVDEVKVPDGYTKTVSGDQTQGFTITNKHTPETTEVLVEKVWNDRNDQDGLRPASITVQLKANGNNEGAAVTLDADNNWQYRWTDLDKKSEGNDIAYTVDEVEVPEGYTKTVSGDQTQGFTITNEHTPETIEVLVEKVWNDGDDQDGLRPDSITVQLKANGNNKGDAVILNANNNWQYKWTDLDKKSEGRDIVYTVDEVKVPDGYTKTVSGDQTNGFTITNTHKPLVTDISVNKVWNDKDNQDNKRPSSVTVQLFVGETAVSEKIVLDESNKWQHTWTNLAVNNSGNKIEYTVKELNKPDEYYYITSGSIEEGFTITNSYPVKKIDITAIKEWSDRIDEDKKRPDSVTIQLTANGENIGDPVVLDKNNNWQTEWKDLDCYKDGKLINYRVIETKVPDGYTHEITKTARYTGEGDDKVITGYHFNVNNIYPIPKTTVSVSKAWDDADDQDGIRPEAVKVNLIANGETVGETITLNKDNKWSYTWSDLNIYSNGSKINYTVEEVDVEKGYRPEVTGSVSDGFVITNKHKPAETSVTVTKKWEDNKNQDGMRPENVEVILSANGKQVGSSIELDKDNNWTHTWTGLAKNANGEPINYTVDEVKVPEGYTKSIAEPVVNEDGTVKCTITNSHVPMTTNISVEKVWRDGNDQDGLRPVSINVILKADGQQVGTAVTLNSQNSWKHTWENLAVKNAGSDIEYTVEEKPVSEGKNEVKNYTAEITGDAATGFTIINTHKPAETSFRVTKAWDDADNQDNIRPDSITVQLYANGSKHGEPVALGEANGWSYKWTELAKYENGVEIVYTVDETAIPDGYTKDIKGSTITNTHVPEVTQVTFTKKWVDNDNQDGKRPSNIQVQLYADGDKVGSPVTVTAADNWTYTWKDLAKNSAGEVITYTAKEVEVPDGYNASADGMTITNTHTPETINIEGTKTWKDNDDQDGVRPASITVRLLANGKEVRAAVVTEADDWSWLFEDLPKYEGGNEISYVITEDAVQDYSTAIEGYDIINTHAPGKTSITVTKSWNDQNDIAKVRPAKVSIQLYADGEPYGEAVTLDAKGSWSYTWAELDLKKAGKVIEYTVEEVDVPKGYEAEVTGDPTTGYIVTNTVDPKIIEDAIDTGDGSTPWGFGIASLFALCAAAGALFFRRRTE